MSCTWCSETASLYPGQAFSTLSRLQCHNFFFNDRNAKFISGCLNSRMIQLKWLDYIVKGKSWITQCIIFSYLNKHTYSFLKQKDFHEQFFYYLIFKFYDRDSLALGFPLHPSYPPPPQKNCPWLIFPILLQSYIYIYIHILETFTYIHLLQTYT